MELLLAAATIASLVAPTPSAPPSPTSAASTAGFPWSDLVVQVVGAFIGAIAAFGFALWLARRQNVAQSTSTMITEFSSREMLQSRFITTNVSYKVRDGIISLRDVALTSVQDCPVGFEGEVIDGLNEHQHISLLVGWVRRLAVNLKNGWVDPKIIAATLGGSLQWTLPFFLQLAEEAERIIEDYPSPKPIELRASWVFAVRNVDAQLKKAKAHRRVPGGKYYILSIDRLFKTWSAKMLDAVKASPATSPSQTIELEEGVNQESPNSEGETE